MYLNIVQVALQILKIAISELPKFMVILLKICIKGFTDRLLNCHHEGPNSFAKNFVQLDSFFFEIFMENFLI